MPPNNDGPADERCESCHRLDPINCPCPPEITPEEPTLHAVHVALVTPETAPVLVAIADERVRQVAKWGVQSWPLGTGSASYRNAADVSRAHTDEAAQRGDVTWTDILLEEVFEALAETDPAKVREELVQVAAVAVSIIEDIDRKAAARVVGGRPWPDVKAEREAIDRAISEGRLPLRQPGASS